MSQQTVYGPRAAKQLDAVTVGLARAKAGKERAEADAAAQAVLRRSERERQEALAELSAIAEAERERRAARRRAARAERWVRRRQALASRAVLLATLAVITLFVVVALPPQISFLAQRWPPPMALAGGTALESLTWVFALQGRARDARGLSAAVHQAGIWAAAFVAAAINLIHGAHLWGSAFAVVASCASLAAPITWHMYLFAQREDEVDPCQARRNRRRQRRHRKVARTARWLASALPSELPSDELWTLAWRAVHGAEPGITAELLEAHGRASTKVAEYLRPGEQASMALLTRPMVAAAVSRTFDARAAVAAGFAAARPIAELRQTDSRSRMSPLPRTGAYTQLTARTAVRLAPRSDRTAPVPAVPTGAEVEAKRRAARAAIRRTLAAGGSPSPTEIGRAHGMSPEWGAKQIRAVRTERQSNPAAPASA